MSQEMLQVALTYNNKGYNVIPVGKDKRSLIKWEPYQKNRVKEEEIRGWFKSSDRNIAIITGEISNLFVVDTDTASAIQQVQDLLPDNFITPVQRTPHGGKHFFFRHQEGFSNRARVAPGLDIRTSGGYIVVDPSKNGDGKGWHWLEGLSLMDVIPSPLPVALIAFLKEFAFDFSKERRQNDDNAQNMSSYVVNLFINGRRDEDLFHVANCLVKGGMEDSWILEVLEILAKNCIPEFPIKEVREKIKSAFQRAQRRERNLTEEVRQWVLSSLGVFLSSDVVRCLHLSSREDEKHVSTVLRRLREEEIIEKYGDKRGCYRVIEAQTDEIDFLNVEDKVVDIQWPFDINRWVKILPKNIIIIAGESNAGKTAFLLNVCFLNMGKFKINYYSSEMGALELRDRLNKFQVNLAQWKENINFRERSSNFSDVVKPNDVNIIDFLEITDEFYKVGGMIKEIYDKLKKGIAIIALQKNKGVELGLGGARSIEKARLYLSIGGDSLKIIKAKNWATEFNPNGMEWKFHLLQGAKFIQKFDRDRD